MNLRAFDSRPRCPNATGARRAPAEVEGLSGSHFGDWLRGSDVDPPLTIVNPHGGFLGSLLDEPPGPDRRPAGIPPARA